MRRQLRFFLADFKRMVGKNKARYFYIWMSRQFVAIALYRFERGMFMLMGKGWQILRILFLPILSLLYAYANSEIHYQAEIGPGLSILHTSLGNVVSGKSVIGSNLRLTGGNVIGHREHRNGAIIIGNNCTMGAHSVILGPVVLGDNVKVGSCACVLKDAPDNAILIGVPAKEVLQAHTLRSV